MLRNLLICGLLFCTVPALKATTLSETTQPTLTITVQEAAASQKWNENARLSPVWDGFYQWIRRRFMPAMDDQREINPGSSNPQGPFQKPPRIKPNLK